MIIILSCITNKYVAWKIICLEANELELIFKILIKTVVLD